MYSLPFKYEYAVDVVVFEPRIALPCNDTRELFTASVVAVRARTVRVLRAFARVVAAV